MGPTNIALVMLFKADQQLRARKGQLDAASHDVRIQQRRVDDLAERQRLAHSKLMEIRSKTSQIELDLKTRDEHIEKLRLQQQNAKTNKEYQAFLVEISTEKVDKAKIEEDLLKLMEQVETAAAEEKDLSSRLQSESTKLATMKAQIAGRLSVLQAEIDALMPAWREAHEGVPEKARDVFDRLAEHHEGEALSAVGKPDRRREEYVCSACNMELVTDVYNKLHSRDDLLFCPSCRRILYIPEDLPPEMAVHKKKPAKPRKATVNGAAAPRQQSAVDVMNSITPDPDDTPETPGEPDAV
jgi:uncharacterized protein